MQLIGTIDKEWERKQRNKEYRVAARREKRNRKGDEKKQRKLNATILRRMTRNPEKYSKNAERNRIRDIEGERRRIWQEAVRQAQHLAAIHDPTGAAFNVGPVVRQDDGTVISEETLRRREERKQAKAAAEQARQDEPPNESTTAEKGNGDINADQRTVDSLPELVNGVNPDRLARMELGNAPKPSRLSKTQLKKRAALEPRPPPPRPTIPENVTIPEAEENWVALWDLSDDQLERRVLREKKRKAAERKALRVKQKSGKAERRIARDEKRKVYRDIKLTWKAIKGISTFLRSKDASNDNTEEQVRERTKLKSIEDEESKKIAVDINVKERKVALDHCATLGFTISNTPGVDEVKPRALGMKGLEVDFDAIETGESRSDIKAKPRGKRVDLGDAPEDTKAEYIPSGLQGGSEEGDEFIKLDVGDGQDFKTLNYNHKLRRKLRRAIDNAEIRKETLVRQRALEYYHEKGLEAPALLKTPYKPINVKGSRILDNGTFETAKQERVRARLDLAEFNTQMRVLRKQAKDAAIYAGLQKHAELLGRVPPSESTVDDRLPEIAPKADANDVTGKAGNFSTLDSPAPRTSGAKRSRDEDEESSSEDETQTASTVETPPLSEESSDSAHSSQADHPAAMKRRKLDNAVQSVQSAQSAQSESMNKDRQAMIDAERVLNRGALSSNPNYASLKKVDSNVGQEPFKKNAQGVKSSSTWNVGGLNGDKTRKTKFLRLLGAQKSTSMEEKETLENSGFSAGQSKQIDEDLERQYADGMAYKQNAKRKGLGS